uniref:hypothetical protein n=1 Tax=Dysosmobacter welbionis TaxID=2093857 RepID=UPI003AB7899B
GKGASAIPTRQRRAATKVAYKRFAKQNLGEAGLCLAEQNQIKGSHWAKSQWERWRRFAMSCREGTSPFQKTSWGKGASAIPTRQRRAATKVAYKRFAKQSLGEAGLCLAEQNQIKGSH